jgi:hypothetical protein
MGGRKEQDASMASIGLSNAEFRTARQRTGGVLRMGGMSAPGSGGEP